MVEMSCEEHDALAASTQFITHTVGRMLGAMQVGGLGRRGRWDGRWVCGLGGRPPGHLASDGGLVFQGA